MSTKYIAILALALCISCTDESLTALDVSMQSNTQKMTRIIGNHELGNSSITLLLNKKDSSYIASLKCYGQEYLPEHHGMVTLQVWSADLSSSSWCSQPYDSAVVNPSGDSLIAYTTITSAKRSKFFVTDTYTYSPERGTVRLSRDINVTRKNNADGAFNSYVMIRKASEQQYTMNEYYVPSLIFIDGSNMTTASIGSNWMEDWILAREERMGLPLVMMRDKETQISLSIIDHNLNPKTLSSDWGNNHQISPYFNYASMGYNLTGNAPVLTYCYPGSEGERSYSDGGGHAEKVWARRSTTLNKGVHQKYDIEFFASKNKDFAEAQRDHWRTAFDLYSPEELDVDSKEVLEASIETLDHYWLKSENAPGFPFSVFVDNGEVHETSFDMGFVGMQASCGYYLYRYGLDHNNETYRKKGEQILDFWANNSANEVGMPRIWYDIAPWNSWRNSNDLRNMQGGMEAMILAWSCAEAHHPGSHANWLRYCKNAADWMIKQQQSNGSFPKSYYNDGNVADAGSYLTSNIIRFLSNMYGATRKPSYYDAIVKAADWCLQHIHNDYKYIGSVIDNPYIKDRESGQKMIEAMLAAYDLTGNDKYLEAAKQAAYYTVSYMYAWNIPWETGTTLNMPWPLKKSTVGITIIATGHSGADCGFSYNSFEYLRLYNLTGDEYFLRIAKLLEKNTKQTMNYDGSLGYPLRGLQREAIRLVTHRGDGVNLWLPWCTASALDPLFRMEDAYGAIGIDNIVGRNSKRSFKKLDESKYVKQLGLVRLPEGKTY